MGGASSKNKGANAEREVRDLLGVWLRPVFEASGKVPPDIQRNLMQSRAGGYDLVGLDWLALEVKRQEQVCLPAWWRQTLKQAGPDQVPFLFWRQNRSPWRCRARVPLLHGIAPTVGQSLLTVDLAVEDAEKWLQYETWWRLQKETK